MLTCSVILQRAEPLDQDFLEVLADVALLVADGRAAHRVSGADGREDGEAEHDLHNISNVLNELHTEFPICLP